MRELVDRSIQGDAEAFAGLYDLLSDDVYRYFYHHVGRAEDAEDLVSRTFLRVWRAIPGFKWRGSPFEAWLFTVARNQLIDFLRRQPVRATSLHDAGERCLDEDPGPETLAIRSLQAAAAMEALAKLTFEQREVIVLKFFLDRDNQEIARIMGKREGTVRALQMRALQALRRHLADV